MKEFEILQRLGLSEKETQIYLALVRKKDCGVRDLSKDTGIHRRSCYDALFALSEKGLVTSWINNGVQTFNATPPDSFRSIVREQETLVEELLPLLKQTKHEKKEPLVEVFRGSKSVKTVFEQLLSNGKTIHIYGGYNPAIHHLKYYYPKFTNMRVKKNVPIKSILVDVPSSRENTKTLPLYTSRFIDKKYFSPSFWWVQGDQVSFVFWRENPIIIRITDNDLSKTYLGSFSLLWKVAKK